ncbi:MAG: alpha/beta hydrolase, partial [Kordiimonadaceae bacterium]|nr:alpha/beta hydrolase [Kordiimonadaceae bacterium]
KIIKKIIHDAAKFRAQAYGEIDIAYGPSARERFDLFLPACTPKGLAVFIHGGYWLEFDKSAWSHLATGCLLQDWAVCLPSYDLCPDVRISDITKQVGAAITAATALVSGPISITGHSAGGHLAARMGCQSTPLSEAVANRVKNIVGISGLYDLTGLSRTRMNKDLKLTETEIAAESPALQAPLSHINLTSWVGGLERPEFIRQSKNIVTAWQGKAAATDYIETPYKHHFNVIDELADPKSMLVAKLLA